LAQNTWGQGYASEAAKACVDFAFSKLALDELVSFCFADNMASRAVMKRIGMVRDLKGDFDHPALPEGHDLRCHFLYRYTRAAHERGYGAYGNRSGVRPLK